MKNLLPISLFTLLVAHASAQSTLIAMDSQQNIYTVNPANASKVSMGNIPAMGAHIAALAYDPYSNTLFGASTDADALYKVDVVSGTKTLIGAFSDPGVLMHSMAFNTSNGKLYGVSSFADNRLYEINPTTATVTPIGISNFGSYALIGYKPTTNQMFRTGGSPANLFQVSVVTGTTAFVGPTGATTTASEMSFNPDNQTMYLMDNFPARLMTLNLATGAATLVGPLNEESMLSMAFIPGRNYIRGTIDLSDVVSNPTFPRSIRVEVTISGNTYYTNAQVYGSGRYTIAIPQGTTGLVRLHADGSSFLSKTQSVILNGGDATSNFVLTNGDPDLSGEVDAADIDLVISQFGTTDQGDYDVDMSGEVDAADIDIVIANFGQTNQ